MKTIIILAIVGALLIFMNPDKEDFREHAERVVANELATTAQSIPGGDILGRVGGMVAGELAADAFTRNNYLFFSTYELNVNSPGLEAGKWKFLGIGTMFFEIERPSIR